VCDLTVTVGVAFLPLLIPDLQQPKGRKHEVDAQAFPDYVRGAGLYAGTIESVFLQHFYVFRATNIGGDTQLGMKLGPFSDGSAHQVDDVLNAMDCDRDCRFPKPHCMTSKRLEQRTTGHQLCK
jgi:hypothetical protein